MLAAIGVTPEEERIYRVLIEHPGARVTELVTPTGLETDGLAPVLSRLESLGLASATADTPPRYIPAPPQLAIEALIAHRQDGIERARLAAAQLMSRYVEQPSMLGSAAMVEVLHGRDAVRQRFQQLERNVQSELCVLDKPPYAVPHSEDEDELRLLERGVQVRGIYERSVLDDTQRLQHIRLLQEHGEVGRVLPALPIKVAIADRSVALVPLTLDGRSSDQTWSLIHPCGLLDALLALFDALWDQAVPLRLALRTVPNHDAAQEPITEADRQLLALMLAGLQDQAAGRQLGVTRRTVARRVARLMRLADADTRFQLGWRAAQREWV